MLAFCHKRTSTVLPCFLRAVEHSKGSLVKTDHRRTVVSACRSSRPATSIAGRKYKRMRSYRGLISLNSSTNTCRNSDEADHDDSVRARRAECRKPALVSTSAECPHAPTPLPVGHEPDESWRRSRAHLPADPEVRARLQPHRFEPALRVRQGARRAG